MAGAPDPVPEAERGTLAARIRTILSESAIYGVLVVSAMIIVTGRKSETSWELFVTVLSTILVFWVAHVFAVVVSNLGLAIGGDKTFGALLLYGIRHSSGLLLGALIPLAIILLGALGVLADETAMWTALGVDIVILGLIGYVAVARMTPSPWARAIGTLVTSLLGVVIVALKAFFH
eukprot:TRINITY_DN8820_c0_g2_i1.p2 TRINITY_DN8820_c0_g2~~TRINITY_DN8820_c0_g2_i1.p2  ORF type:complete len:177 (-),score=37.86 TRINITY_DN8820_c0_g2_i1:119-649(-)